MKLQSLSCCRPGSLGHPHPFPACQNEDAKWVVAGSCVKFCTWIISACGKIICTELKKHHYPLLNWVCIKKNRSSSSSILVYFISPPFAANIVTRFLKSNQTKNTSDDINKTKKLHMEAYRGLSPHTYSEPTGFTVQGFRLDK